MLDAADIYVLLKVASMPGSETWSQNGLGHEIGVSPSVVNRALKKAEELKLYSSDRKRLNGRPLVAALVHGARYFIAPKRGGEVRGLPTAWAAPPLAKELVSNDALPPVWPDSNGEVRGLSIEPLHPSAPMAARRDLKFYELLALVDALRLGGSRERTIAQKELEKRLAASEEN